MRIRSSIRRDKSGTETRFSKSEKRIHSKDTATVELEDTQTGIAEDTYTDADTTEYTDRTEDTAASMSLEEDTDEGRYIK